MESFEKRIKLQRDLERFNVEKSIEGTASYYLQQDIEKGISEEEILEKAKSGYYANTWQNRKKGIVGQKYGSEKKVSDSIFNLKPGFEGEFKNKEGEDLYVRVYKDGGVKVEGANMRKDFNTTQEAEKYLNTVQASSKKEKMDLSKHSIQELQDAMRIRVKSGMSESDLEMKQLQAELDKRQHSKPKHISDMSKDEKLSAAKGLGIKNPELLSLKELNKQIVDKNIENQIKAFRNKKD